MSAIIRFIHKHFFLILFSSIAISLGLSCLLPTNYLSHILGLSLLLKECIIVVMPWLIMACAFNCMYSMKSKGVWLIILGFTLICLSNLVSSWIGFGISHLIHIPALPIHQEQQASGLLVPSFSVQFPALLRNSWALMLGLSLGSILGLKKSQSSETIYLYSRMGVDKLLNYFLIPILPFFISGFFIKLHQDGTLSEIFKTYAIITLVLILAYTSYLLLTYWLVGECKMQKAIKYIRNVLPAGWVGFSAMSSLAALPINLKAADQNTNGSEIVGGILPISTNIHLVGDSIGIPLLAMAILITFGYPLPDPHHYFLFSIYFVLAKFSVAAVPGGGILVMLPILTQYLGFTGEMSALITALYLLLDPIITSVNVMGNGMFVILLDKIYRSLTRAPNKIGLKVSSQS